MIEIFIPMITGIAKPSATNFRNIARRCMRIKTAGIDDMQELWQEIVKRRRVMPYLFKNFQDTQNDYWVRFQLECPSR